MSASGSPVSDSDQAVGAFTEDMGKPNGNDSANAGPLPMAVRAYMGVNQRANVQILDQPEQEGDTVDLFIGQSGRVTMWCWQHRQDATTLALASSNFRSLLRE